MEVIDKNYTIEHTRGDKGSLILKSKETSPFKIGDILTFSIITKGNYSDVVFQKEFKIEEETVEFVLSFTNEEMRIGDPINDKVTYYYEIDLNDDTTLIGSRKTHKQFILYPEVIKKGVN